MPDATYTDWIGAAGSAVGGMAALGAAALAAWRVSKELRTWRRQRLADRRSEAAAAAIIATERFREALYDLTNPLPREGDPERPASGSQGERVTGLVRARLPSVEGEIRAFREAYAKALAYLPESIVKPMDDLSAIPRKVVANALSYSGFMEAEDKTRASKHFDQTLGPGIQEEITKLSDDATHRLRPYAQMEDPPAPGGKPSRTFT